MRYSRPLFFHMTSESKRPISIAAALRKPSAGKASAHEGELPLSRRPLLTLLALLTGGVCLREGRLLAQHRLYLNLYSLPLPVYLHIIETYFLSYILLLPALSVNAQFVKLPVRLWQPNCPLAGFVIGQPILEHLHRLRAGVKTDMALGGRELDQVRLFPKDWHTPGYFLLRLWDGTADRLPHSL